MYFMVNAIKSLPLLVHVCQIEQAGREKFKALNHCTLVLILHTDGQFSTTEIFLRLLHHTF